MSRIIRKVKARLGVALSRQEVLKQSIESLAGITSISNVQQIGNIIQFSYYGNTVIARTDPHSDVYVARQVFGLKEYFPVIDFIKNNLTGRSNIRIIDAGANVGYTSVYFLNEFPGASMACIEPDEGNIALLEKNLATYIQDKRSRIFRNGLMGKAGVNISTSNEFRDGKDWSVTVGETQEESSLKSTSIDAIISEMGWENVDIIKIDIEGSERFVFENGADLDFLDYVACLAIEIHDEFKCREQIYQLLKSRGFLLFNFAETTLAISKTKFLG